MRPVATERIFTQGSLQQTENSLDMAINGQGFFQIQMPDGTLAYTRDGAFQMDSTGQIGHLQRLSAVAGDHHPGERHLHHHQPRRHRLGAQAGTATPTQVGNIQLASFVNPGGLQSAGENLYVETASSGTPTPNTPGSNGTGLLNQGYVETSNVNVAEELVTMIQTQRAYEINSKAIQTSDSDARPPDAAVMGDVMKTPCCF